MGVHLSHPAGEKEKKGGEGITLRGGKKERLLYLSEKRCRSALSWGEARGEIQAPAFTGGGKCKFEEKKSSRYCRGGKTRLATTKLKWNREETSRKGEKKNDAVGLLTGKGGGRTAFVILKNGGKKI